MNPSQMHEGKGNTNSNVNGFYLRLIAAISAISITLILYAIAWNMMKSGMIMSPWFMLTSLFMILGLIASIALSARCHEHPKFKDKHALNNVGAVHWMNNRYPKSQDKGKESNERRR